MDRRLEGKIVNAFLDEYSEICQSFIDWADEQESMSELDIILACDKVITEIRGALCLKGEQK